MNFYCNATPVWPFWTSKLGGGGHGHVIGAKAMLCWQYSQRALMMPGAIIDVAERTDAIFSECSVLSRKPEAIREQQ
jgi:hypothetical protein